MKQTFTADESNALELPQLGIRLEPGESREVDVPDPESQHDSAPTPPTGEVASAVPEAPSTDQPTTDTAPAVDPEGSK